MSHIPGRSFSIDQSLTDPRDDANRFYELMKSATSDDKNAPGDTDRSTIGVNPDPKDREENIAAPWSEEPNAEEDDSGTAQFHSNAAWDGLRRSREEFLDRNFDNYEPSKKVEVAQLSQRFDRFNSGDHEPSKPFTNNHSKRSPEVVETVLDKTKRLLNRS